jgi:hypothetical protein
VTETTTAMQAYTLICTVVNQDKTMLEYLWDSHGSVLWNENHLRELIRCLIIEEWTEGINYLFESEITH